MERTNKFQKIFTRMLIATAGIASGAVFSSLYFYNNDNWKTHLPIALLCLTLERFINTDK
jgi:hypothetical protein